MNKYLRRLQSLDRDESGSAMTEFVIFLPVWYFLFMGIFALAELNMETTRVKLIANKQVWDGVIPITDYSNMEYASKVTAGTAAGTLIGLSGESPETSLFVAAAASQTALANGHWTESYLMVAPYDALNITENVDDLTEDPKDIVGDRKYPLKIVDDTVTGVDTSGGVFEILMEVISASGLTHGTAAGIRYGTVFGEVEDHQIQVAGRMTYSANAHYDILVAPAPLKGLENKVTIGVARAMAETQDEYSVMMNFGEAEWEGDGSGYSDGRLDDFQDDIDEMNDDAANNQDEIDDRRDDVCSDPENLDENC